MRFIYIKSHNDVDIWYIFDKILFMKYFFLLAMVATIFFSSCSTAEMDLIEETPNLFRNGNFENQLLALDLWTNEGEGDFSVGDENAFEGKYAMKLQPESCIQLEYLDMVYVEEGKLYELSLAIQMVGEPTNCSGDLIMYVYQDENVLLQFNINKSSAESWAIKKYYLTTVSDTPLRFEIISGVKETYLDDIRLMQITDMQ